MSYISSLKELLVLSTPSNFKFRAGYKVYNPLIIASRKKPK